MIQGDAKNEWYFAQDWQARMCEKAANCEGNFSQVYTSEHPAWAAKYGNYYYVCTRDGSTTVEKPPGQLYLLNLSTGMRRYVHAVEGHDGAKNTGSFAIDVRQGLERLNLPQA